MRPATANLVTVDKVAAIRRQIDTAIWLWFNEGDIVSIHTLIDAAFGILDDLYQARKMGRPMPFDDDASKTTPEQRKWRKKLKEAGTFGKHARADHDRAYQYSPIFIECQIAFAITAHAKLEKVGRNSLQTLFSLWFWMHYPEFTETSPKHPERIDVQTLRKLSRCEFFEKFGRQFIPPPE
jgi:hypothetical protein